MAFRIPVIGRRVQFRGDQRGGTYLDPADVLFIYSDMVVRVRVNFADGSTDVVDSVPYDSAATESPSWRDLRDE